jgi:hypothetical protein
MAYPNLIPFVLSLPKSETQCLVQATDSRVGVGGIEKLMVRPAQRLGRHGHGAKY